MSIFNFFKKTKDLEIGKVISWKESVNMLFKILDFDRNGTISDGSRNIKAKSMFVPYGYLLVENPNFTTKLKLPIIHKDDFF
jgi:hypothetical protein